jgi:FkbM family methyltransferase
LSLTSVAWRLADACLPSRSKLLFRLGRKLQQRYLGEGDDDMCRNGELLIAQRLMGGSTGAVADIGANLGEWSRAILKLAPQCEIHMFEPVGATFAQLGKTDWPKQVRLTRAAIGDKAGTVAMLVSPDMAGSNSVYRRTGVQVKPVAEEIVPCMTLDDYCREQAVKHLSFVKIDVEGHELAVLRGAARMLRESRIDAVQFEYGGTYIDARVFLKDVFSYMEETAPSYRLYKMHRRGLIRAPAYSQEFDNFQYANWLMARAELVDAGSLGPLVS